MNKTATLLFEMLSKTFERNNIKQFHPIIGGYRAVVVSDSQEYQVTLRPIIDEQTEVDLDEMAKQHVSNILYSGVAAKDKK